MRVLKKSVLWASMLLIALFSLGVVITAVTLTPEQAHVNVIWMTLLTGVCGLFGSLMVLIDAIKPNKTLQTIGVVLVASGVVLFLVTQKIAADYRISQLVRDEFYRDRGGVSISEIAEDFEKAMEEVARKWD